MKRVAAILLLFAPVDAAAQVRLRISGSFALADHRVDAGFGPERSSGYLLGTDIRVGLGPGLAIALAERSGRLAADGGGAIDRDLAEVSAGAEFLPLPWLALETGVIARSYGTVVARQRWTLLRVGAEARVPLSGEALWATARAHLLPIVSVNGLSQPNSAFAAATGMAWTRGRVTVDLAYALERCDFPAAGSVRRVEQLSALVMRGGVTFRLP